MEIIIAARNSPLSRKQVEEVDSAIRSVFPEIVLKPIFIETRGDRDKLTSLRAMDKSDFFTREIDELLLRGGCRIGIHSAKDLPDPLPKGLKVGLLTKGVDPSDALVLSHEKFFPEEGCVATSSQRREEAVRQLFPRARFVDLRGTIQERLEKLWKGEVDGVVIAEAALIRLGLVSLNRILLPGDTAPLQGKLALVIRENDLEMDQLLVLLFKQI